MMITDTVHASATNRCGPCQFIKPVYHQLSRQYHDVVFLEVDEAQNKSLIGALGAFSHTPAYS